LVFFWGDWMSILKSFGRKVFRGAAYEKQTEGGNSGRLLIPIVVATIPAAVAGMLFNDRIEAMRTAPWMLPAVAGTLAAVAVVMLLAERVGQKKRTMESMNYADYISIGCAQALALFAGVSRSGITISTGLFRGIDRAAAARFSFLLSTPIILAAGLKQLKDVCKTGIPQGELMMIGVGFVAAAVSGYLAIKFLMSYLQRGSLKVFAIYRFVLAAAILVAFIR
jgi:undecaprenyl-diphosphatase